MTKRATVSPEEEPLPEDTSRHRVSTLALVVVAHDRPSALDRLLSSLLRLRIPTDVDVPLVISVDGSVPATLEVANRTEWPFGDKEVIARPERMGLRAHVLSCGDLTGRFDTIAVLEDDLFVSPDAYRYATEAADMYRSETPIAGTSLYSYRLDEYQRLAFRPLDDGYDTFFMQMPSSWGQVWTASQWNAFREWLAAVGKIPDVRLPARAAAWPADTSWKRAFLSYLIDTDRYFVFPSRSLTSNCGDAGAHFRRATTNLTTPIADGPRQWRFAPWSDAAIRYDAWFEPIPELLSARWPELVPEDVTVDFRADKAPNQVQTPWLISSRPCKAPVSTFPFLLQPEALNLDLEGTGTFFCLGRREHFGAMPPSKRRRLREILNGEITHETAVGIVWDRVRSRLRSAISAGHEGE